MDTFRGQQGLQWILTMAASIISMVPTVAILLVLQRHLARYRAVRTRLDWTYDDNDLRTRVTVLDGHAIVVFEDAAPTV